MTGRRPARISKAWLCDVAQVDPIVDLMMQSHALSATEEMLQLQLLAQAAAALAQASTMPPSTPALILDY